MPETVSAVVPTRGRPAFLAEALRSVALQTRPPDECLVVADGDPGPAVPVHAGCVPLRTLTLAAGSGASRCRNRGAALAKGDWIAFLDDDDLWHPRKTEAQLAAARARPEVALVYCDYQRFDDEVGVFEEVPLGRRFRPDPDAFAAALLGQPVTGSTSAYLVRRDAFEAISGFDESLAAAQDYDLSLRLAAAGFRFAAVPEPLLFYRTHPGQLSRDARAKAAATERVLRRKEELFPEAFRRHREAIEAEHRRALAWIHLLDGDALGAAREVWRMARGGASPRTTLRLAAAAALTGTGLLDPLLAARRRRGARRHRAATALLAEIRGEAGR